MSSTISYFLLNSFFVSVCSTDNAMVLFVCLLCFVSVNSVRTRLANQWPEAETTAYDFQPKFSTGCQCGRWKLVFAKSIILSQFKIHSNWQAFWIWIAVNLQMWSAKVFVVCMESLEWWQKIFKAFSKLVLQFIDLPQEATKNRLTCLEDK